MLFLSVLSMSLLPAAYGSEFCGDWTAAEIDATEGKYSPVLELRSCDLTGGVSAFLQMKNSGVERLKVTYRAHTEEKIPKDDELVLAPGETKRGATCLQCSRRKGGLKLWEIVSVEVQAGPAQPQSAVPADPASLPAASSSVDVTPPAPAKPQPAAAPSMLMEPVNQASPAPEKLPDVPSQQKTEPVTELPKSQSENPSSWDQLPPEFRPRK